MKIYIMFFFSGFGYNTQCTKLSPAPPTCHHPPPTPTDLILHRDDGRRHLITNNQKTLVTNPAESAIFLCPGTKRQCWQVSGYTGLERGGL